MGLLKFTAPRLPNPPKDDVDANYINQLLRTLSNYFSLLESTTPIQVDSIILSGLPNNGNGLANGSVFQSNGVLYIVLADRAYAPTLEATTSLGSFTVTTV
jgi:hypothetical protein